MSAAEGLNKGSNSQKKRMFSESWIGKKLSRKSASVDDDLLDPERHSSVKSNQSSSSDDRGHIYDVVPEFKTIEEHEDTTAPNNSSSDDDVFGEDKDLQQKTSETDPYDPVSVKETSETDPYDPVSIKETSETDPYDPVSVKETTPETDPYDPVSVKETTSETDRYDPVSVKETTSETDPYDPVSVKEMASETGPSELVSLKQTTTEMDYYDEPALLKQPTTETDPYDPVTPGDNVVQVIVKDEEPEINSVRKEPKVVSVIPDESTAQAFEDPTYTEELQADDGVEELRKMIRDSGLEFDDVEDDYERIEGADEDTPAMAKLREMLGTM